jgi:hypothetical protein
MHESLREDIRALEQEALRSLRSLMRAVTSRRGHTPDHSLTSFYHASTRV